jgi:hypothetical protein
MYHCHFGGHEDGGMMRQFLVIDPNATAIEHSVLPEGDFKLSNYPNPFAEWTTISYTLEKRSDIRIAIYDALGREVKTLFNGQRDAGQNESIWKAESVPTGTYFIQVEINGRPVTRQIQIRK